MAILFINVISGENNFSSSYGTVAIDVLIVSRCVTAPCVSALMDIIRLQYLGIPLVAGVVTRYTVWSLTSRHWLETRFLPCFGPLALVGLLYTIFVLFAYQGKLP